MHHLSESPHDVLLDAYEFTLACQSVHHEANDAPQVTHRGEPRFFVDGPCRHTTGLRCESAALDAMTTPDLWCSRCRSFYPRHAFSYSPVEF